MNAKLTLLVKKLPPEARLPERRDGDIGWGIFALSVESLGPTMVKVHTGIALELPAGYYCQIENRSSMGKNGWDVHGGIIDNAYRGEIMVILTQHRPGEILPLEPGSKIAQLIVRREEDSGWTLQETDTLSGTERGHGGFGSTGR